MIHVDGSGAGFSLFVTVVPPLVPRYPLNTSLSLDSPLDTSLQETTLAETLSSDTDRDPEEALLQREDTRQLRETLAKLLTEFELHVLALYQLGKSYREIGAELDVNVKSVDNALSRIKHKVSSIPLGFADLSSIV